MDGMVLGRQVEGTPVALLEYGDLGVQDVPMRDQPVGHCALTALENVGLYADSRLVEEMALAQVFTAQVATGEVYGGDRPEEFSGADLTWVELAKSLRNLKNLVVFPEAVGKTATRVLLGEGGARGWSLWLEVRASGAVETEAEYAGRLEEAFQGDEGGATAAFELLTALPAVAGASVLHWVYGFPPVRSWHIYAETAAKAALDLSQTVALSSRMR